MSGSVKEAKKILLVDHKKAELWLSAGGHVEIDEHPKKNVERECAEELGAEAGFWLKYPLFLSSSTTVGQTAGHTDVSLWYLLKGHSNTPYYFDRGAFHAIHWFSVDEVSEQKTDPHMARFIEKLKSLFI